MTTRNIVKPNIQRTTSIISPLKRVRSHATDNVEAIIKEACREVYAKGQWHGELLI